MTGAPAVTDVEVIEAMLRYGGSFVVALAKAAERADPINLARIKAVWSDYWEQYTEMALRIRK